MEIMSIIAWGLGALGAGILGYSGWSYSNRYYLRGRRKALGFVTGPIKPPKSLFDNWTTELPKFKDQVFNAVLEVENKEITENITKLQGEAQSVKNTVEGLEDKKAELLKTTSDKEASVDDAYYTQTEERVAKEIEQIDKDIAELREPLSEVADRRIEQSSEKVKPRVARTDIWYKGIVDNLRLVSDDLSHSWLALGMLLFDWVIAVTFFEDLAKTVRNPEWLHFAMAYILPLVITLLAMWLMHITAHSVRTAFRNGLGRINSLDLVGASFAGMGLMFVLGLVLVLRLQIAPTFIEVIKEVLFWSLFVVFVIIVGYEGSKPEKHKTVNDFVKIPVLLILNAVGLVFVLPLWVLERIWMAITGVFSSSLPTSEKAKELQKRVKQLEDDKKLKQDQLDKLRQERDAFRRGEITRSVQEAEARLQAEIKNIDESIATQKKELEKLQKVELIWQTNMSNLRKGCNDGVDAGLSSPKFAKAL